MKVGLNIGLFVFLITILAMNVHAASFDEKFPSVVLAGQDFFIEGGSLTCTDSGANTCLINWTNLDGSETGFFVESVSGADPDGPNRVQRLNEPGTYLVEIYQCAAGPTCPAAPDDSMFIEAVDPNPSNPVSLEWNFNLNSGGTMLMQGYAPADAVSVRLRLYPIDSSTPNVYPSLCRPVTQGADPEFTGTFHALTDGWYNESYFVFANFFDAASCAGTEVLPRAYGGEFNYLHLLAIEASIADLEANLTTLNATLAGADAALQAQIDDAVAALAALNATVITLETDLNALEADVLALETTVADLQTQIDQLNNGRINLVYNDATQTLRVRLYFPIGATEALIQAHNAADDSLVYSVSGITPDADGAFNYDWDVSSWDPLAYTIKARFDNATGDRVGRFAAEPFNTLFILWLDERISANEDAIANIELDIDVLNMTVEEHSAHLAAVDENLTQILAELVLINANITDLHANDSAQQAQIDDLVTRVETLETDVATLQEIVKSIQGDLSLVWDSDADRLRVKLYFPPGSSSARLYAYDSNDNQRFGPITVTDTGAPRQQDYDWDVSSWPIDTYTIKVNFLGAGDFYAWRSELFDNLLLRWLEENQYGFDLVDAQTFEVFNPQDNFVRHMSWAFTADEDSEWWYELVQTSSTNEEDISKVFAGGTCYSASEKVTRNFVRRNIVFPPVEGSYRVQLRAHNCETDEVVRSNRFWIDIIDLAQPLPSNSAGISELGILQGGSGTYWTANTFESFDVLLQSTNGWSSALDCIVRYEDGLGGQNVKIWDMSAYGGNVTQCSGTLNIEQITTDNEGPWTLEVCGEPREHNPSGLDELCDSLDIGFDNVAPVIDEETLNPGVENILSGLWNFSANVGDNGEVMTVEFSLIDKDNASNVCNLGFATNTDGDLWEIADFDTETECTPDGAYNFSVTATDFAGNVAVLEIDPVIDNTAPVVESLVLGGFVPEMTIEATVTDNLAGVLSAQATIYRYTCNDVLVQAAAPEVSVEEVAMCSFDDCESRSYDEFQQVVDLALTSGGSLNGVWTANFETESGWHYEVIVDATDGAGNEASDDENGGYSTRYARPGYTVTLEALTNNLISGQTMSVKGTVTSSDGSQLPNAEIVLTPGSSTPVVLNEFMADVGGASTGNNEIVATYTPYAECEDAFTATTTISAVKGSGSGGGGGGSFSAPRNNVGGENQETEEPSSNTEQEASSNNEQQGSSGNSEQANSEDTQSEPAATEESSNDNLLTGAVTGSGFFKQNWPWLAVLGGLIVLLYGGYRLAK